MSAPSSSSVSSMISSMSIEARVAQLLHPFVRPNMTAEEIKSYLGGLEPGGVFIMPGNRKEVRATAETVQSLAKTPVVITSDLECGPGRMVLDATVFPDMMALAATGDHGLARIMGRAAALEGLEAGIHWNFAPVVDINLNPQNPITNTRSLGDRPDKVSSLAIEFIKGMQENGMAGCAKHFPGDGYDSRDQHVCTSVNPLGKDRWWELNGSTYRRTIEADVWSIMIGHISLPWLDGGAGKCIGDAPPATLSKAIVTDLLRGELGFKGMIVSDASFMGGFTSWGSREEIVPRMVEAGCDQVLFCDFQKDFERLMKALEDGPLSEERVDEAVRYVLELKQRLGLFAARFGNPVSPDIKAEHENASRALAKKAITLVKDTYGAVPLKLKPGSKVLSYHLRGDALYHVDGVDDLLRDAGCDVVRKTEEDIYGLPGKEELAGFDALLVHVVYGPSWNTNRIRPNGNFLRDVVLSLPFHDKRLVFISYGTPYILHDLPRIPALINAYSPDPVTQAAVIDVLLGKAPAIGKSPVKLELDWDWFPVK